MPDQPPQEPLPDLAPYILLDLTLTTPESVANLVILLLVCLHFYELSYFIALCFLVLLLANVRRIFFPRVYSISILAIYILIRIAPFIPRKFLVLLLPFYFIVCIFGDRAIAEFR